MTNPIFVLFRPRIAHEPAERFYRLLKRVLSELSIRWVDDFNRGEPDGWQQYCSTKYIHLTWHTKGYRRGLWHLNRGPLPGTIEWDFLGYACYSSILKKKRISMQAGDRQLFERFATHYITSRISKFAQPAERTDLSSVGRFIFFPLQIVDDSVMKVSSHNSYEACCLVAKNLRDLGLQLVVKIHPRDLLLREHVHAPSPQTYEKVSAISGAKELLSLIKRGIIIVLDCNVHDLLRSCESVALVNSGVGLEGLLHKKTVYSWAPSLYHYATFSLHDELLEKPAFRFQKAFPLDSAVTILGEIMRNHLIFLEDINSIKRAVVHMCNNWQKSCRLSSCSVLNDYD